jgi:hypothetical protein
VGLEKLYSIVLESKWVILLAFQERAS